MTAEISDAAALDLTRYIRPGALVAWGQGCAEPLTLTETLAGQRHRLGGVRCFSGISTTAAVRPEHSLDYSGQVGRVGLVRRVGRVSSLFAPGPASPTRPT